MLPYGLVTWMYYDSGASMILCSLQAYLIELVGTNTFSRQACNINQAKGRRGAGVTMKYEVYIVPLAKHNK